MLKPFVRTCTEQRLGFTAGKVYWMRDESCASFPEHNEIVADDDGDTRPFFEWQYRPVLLRDAFVMALQAKGVPAHVANLAAQRADSDLLHQVAGPRIASAGLRSGFLWEPTPEGHAYWAAVARKVDGS